MARVWVCRHDDIFLTTIGVMIVGMGKTAQRRGGQRLSVGIEVELTKSEKLSVVPPFPPLALSTWSEDGLTTIIRPRKIGPHDSY